MGFIVNLFSCFSLCYLMIQLANGEPHCSKFHYEEQLLEKLVRLEFKVAQMQNGYKEMERKLFEERRKLQEDGANLKARFDKSDKHIVSKMNDMESQVRQMGETMLNDVKEATDALEVSRRNNEAILLRLSEDTRKLHNETISNITNLVKVPNVLFKAKDLPNQYTNTLSTNDVFVFKTVLQNEGEGYNAGSGIFTAPSGGDYLFTAQLCSSGTHIYPAFVVDDVEQKAMRIYSSSYGCGTETFLSRLDKGARVWMKSRSTSKTYQDGNLWNTFSGILLKA